jgi:RNA polymerase sigma factor (sigma-70 family)
VVAVAIFRTKGNALPLLFIAPVMLVDLFYGLLDKRQSALLILTVERTVSRRVASRNAAQRQHAAETAYRSPAGEIVGPTPPHPQDGPEVTLQNRQKAEVLLNCLRQLSLAHREVINLVYYHEKSIDEAAEIIGIPQNTVKTRMFYARKRTAELMAAQGIDRAIV